MAGRRSCPYVAARGAAMEQYRVAPPEGCFDFNLPDPLNRPLRIGIDAHAVGSNLGGNESYITAVIEGLKDFPQHEYFIYVTDERVAERVRAFCRTAHIRAIHTHHPLVRLGWRLTQACRADRVDALHVQYVAPIVAPPIVAMVHDLSYHHHPEWFSKAEGLRFRLTVPWTARRAARVLTGSEYCRRDIVSTFRLPEEKVSVSYARIRSIFTERPQTEVVAVLEKLSVRRPYILAVGNLQPRKNLPRLIDAWQRLRTRHVDFTPQLVIVGRKAWMFDDILGSARGGAHAGDIVLTDYLPESELAALYSGASLFVYPSLFEGFGLPPIEAMACGAPVIVSNTTSLPEICGEAALYIDPKNVEQLAARILELYGDPHLQRSYREKGLQQARKFRQNNLIEVTVRAYEEAARQRLFPG